MTSESKIEPALTPEEWAKLEAVRGERQSLTLGISDDSVVGRTVLEP